MSDEDAKVLVQIQVSLAEIKVSVENVLHRFRNLEQAQTAFVPRREIEQNHDALVERLAKLEDRHEWFHRWLWGAWLSGGGFAALVAKKVGLF